MWVRFMYLGSPLDMAPVPPTPLEMVLVSSSPFVDVALIYFCQYFLGRRVEDYIQFL